MISPEHALAITSFTIAGEPVYWDLSCCVWDFGLFHGITAPLGSIDTNVPWHFAANEPAKPPI